MHVKASQVSDSKMAHQIQAHLYHELKSCSLSIKMDAEKEGVKPASRGGTTSKLGTSHLPMKPQSPIAASQREKDRDSHGSSRWSLARVCDLQEAPTQDTRKNYKQNQNQSMFKNLRGPLALVGHPPATASWTSEPRRSPVMKHFLEEAFIRLKLCPLNLQRL